MRTTRLFVCLLSMTIAHARQDWNGVEAVLGRSGTIQGNVLKVGFPRTDLTVKIGNVTVDPALALGSWAAFQTKEGHTMVMGDLVLLESELDGVEQELTAHDFEISAIHNHLVNETPKVMYLHFSGMGEAVHLAEALKSVLARTATPMVPRRAATSAPPPDWSAVERILGRKGTTARNVIQFGIARRETIVERGMTIPPFMGMATSINMQLDGSTAATTGDFVLRPEEVNPVIKALREHGLMVTALHSHMLFESPRLFFMHFWGTGKPEDLARALATALGAAKL